MQLYQIPISCHIIQYSETNKSGAKIINVFRAWIGAHLTICAQKWRNCVLFSTVRLTFVFSRVLCFSL